MAELPRALVAAVVVLTLVALLFFRGFHLEHDTSVLMAKYQGEEGSKKFGSVCGSNVPHFINITQLSGPFIHHLVQRTSYVKHHLRDGKLGQPFHGKVMALVFTKPSLRTRASFQSGFHRLGGTSVYFAPSDVGLGKREAVKDVSRVMSRFFDVIVARVHEHSVVEELACHSSVPIVNGLSNYNHPVQIMSDLFTIAEHFNLPSEKLSDVKVAYVGDCNNIVTSWLALASRISFQLTLVCPPRYPPEKEMLQTAMAAGLSKIEVTSSVPEGLKGADVIYADVWASMGFKAESDARVQYFQANGYTISPEAMKLTGKPTTVFMHCLPAERGHETTDTVLESNQSIIFTQAENRMHMQNTLLLELLGF
eukprot:TRINITY_DN40886_c0_g1_i1.p1 TRINITY_DN40886_c0_g1~~TRINITY_DN40886_c0_g1_i1.p1  ORF type:complete len:366 (+),score=69.27 TRINITY_DN40886_c0_g1_i1:20-1117(+)